MANLTKAQRLAKAAAAAAAAAAATAAAADAASAPPISADQTKTGDSGTAADTVARDAPTAGPVTGFPLRARVRNNTRMPVQVPALNLDLPASGEATITIYSEGGFKTLHSELTALFSLNGLGEDAFAVGPAEMTEA